MSQQTEYKDYFSKISYLMLESNSSCNLECIYCNRKDLEQKGLRKPKNISAQEFNHILNIFKDCPIKVIKFEGLSEPMLHPEFNQLSEALRKTFPSAFVIIATNLQYDLMRTPFLSTLDHVDMVYLSIDGLKENYEKLRYPSKWSQLQDSLSKIKKYVPIQIREKKLHLQFTLTDENSEDLSSMYKLKDEFGLASVRINLAQNWSENEPNTHKFSENLISNLRNNHRADVRGVPTWEYSDCFWPFNGLIADVFGDVRKCVINTDTKPIGNLFKDDIRKIYNESSFLGEVRSSLSSGIAHTTCENCDYHHLKPYLERILGVGSEQIKSFKKEIP